MRATLSISVWPIALGSSEPARSAESIMGACKTEVRYHASAEELPCFRF